MSVVNAVHDGLFLLGMALMNEIVNQHPSIEPDEMLNELRLQIMETLHQKGNPDAARDGMDMVVCKVKRKEGLLQFAGANNPLYLIRNGELIEYKTDKMPVAVHDIMQPFRGQEISLQPGDLIYIFSDGFADQFGGPKRKKFKYRPFKELLLSNSVKDMAEQGLLLDQAFERWMGDMEQIDDVIVIGLKF